MLSSKVSILCLILTCVLGYNFALPDAIQRVFDLGQDTASIEEVPHYTTFEQDELPIDLTRYCDDLVVRVSYAEDEGLKKYLLSHKMAEVRFKKWGRNNNLKTMDIQIDEENLIKLLKKYPGLEYEIIIEDLAQKIFETYPQDYKTKDQGSPYKYKSTEEVIEATSADVFSELFFKQYRPLESIDAWLSILEQSFPGEIKIETIGYTHENRPLNVVHFSAHSDIEHDQRKTVVVSGGVHAREWISISSVLYGIYELLQYYHANPDSKIMSRLDFLFIPVFNPDGYQYTWDYDRLWRKNRQQTINENCKGIDIDHSFDYHFTRSSDWECGEEYSGEYPFEALESKVWEIYLNDTNNDHNIYGFIDLHSYSQEVLFPYAYSCSQQPRDEENLIELAYGISKSIRLQSGETYNVLPACVDKDADLIPDLGAGSGLDFMYHNKAFHAYQLKLRDSGSHGFLLPGKYIKPVGKEIFSGIKYFCMFLLSDD